MALLSPIEEEMLRVRRKAGENLSSLDEREWQLLLTHGTWERLSIISDSFKTFFDTCPLFANPELAQERQQEQERRQQLRKPQQVIYQVAVPVAAGTGVIASLYVVSQVALQLIAAWKG